MIPDPKVTEIYFIINEFFKKFDKTIKEHSLPGKQTRKRNRKFTMSESEVMTILILFHFFGQYLELLIRYKYKYFFKSDKIFDCL